MSAPLPPPDLSTRKPDIVTLKRGSLCHRFHNARYDPVHFDRGPGGRLNAPDGAYGVLYVSERPAGAFAESFLREPGRTQLAADMIARKAYAQCLVSRPLRLVRMAGPGLAKIGATAEIPHGSLPYDAPQLWSQALHAHPGGFDGIAYSARHDDDEVCYALFERAADSISAGLRLRKLDEEWFFDLMERYGVGLAP